MKLKLNCNFQKPQEFGQMLKHYLSKSDFKTFLISIMYKLPNGFLKNILLLDEITQFHSL